MARFTVNEKIEKSPVAMRDALGTALDIAGDKNNNVVYLDADLSNCINNKEFIKKHPERFIQCGIAEADMIGVAAGLSAMGKIPFAHSFGCFSSRRACDQIMISCSYSKLNVRILGSDPGITASHNGGTHMPFEDMAVLRSIPHITLLEPADTVALSNIIAQLCTDEHYGVYYIRMMRKNAVPIYAENENFTIGKGKILRDGSDLTIFASGIMVAEALSAAEILQTRNVSARVVDMFTWKPIDTELIERCAVETKRFIVAENHNVLGGLGSAIAEVTAKTHPVPIKFVGVQDEFGQIGTQSELQAIYGLTAEKIAEGYF